MSDKSKSGKISKELREWLIMIGVFGFLYFTGLHTPLISNIQRLFLMTGIMQPSKDSFDEAVDYNLMLEDLEGKPVSLAEFQGKTVFMNLWATWCAPCLAEMPDIQDLYNETSNDVSFVMISRDRDEEKARDFIKKKGYNFPVYFQRSAMPEVFTTKSIPTTFVLSPDGRVTVKKSGMAKYNTESFRDYLLSL